MRILKDNHHSKNSLTIAVDTDTALLNVDKNNKIIRKNHKNTENKINYFSNIWKKTKIYQTKTFTVTIAQEIHFLTAIMSLQNIHPTDITIVEDLQIEENHVISHKNLSNSQNNQIEIVNQDQLKQKNLLKL